MSLRSTLLLTVTASLASLGFTDAARVTPADQSGQAAAEYLTKLRKLHLVRPDLINYPLVIDFVC